MNRKRGFTLLELLIVIAMLAILAVVIILIINPAETLRKGRDSQRLSDLSTLKSALALYLLRAPNPQLDGGGDGVCGTNVWIGRPSGSTDITDTSVSGRTLVQPNGDRTSAAIDGTGWIPVNFTEIPEGSPINALPMDPNYSVADTASVSDSDFYYSYTCDTDNTFELNANMESSSFAQAGDNDKESSDGGVNPGRLEAGTKLSMLVATLDIQVAASGDDAFHASVTIDFYSPTAGSNQAGHEDPTQANRGSIMRFLNVTIPQGSTIETADLTFTASENRSNTVVDTDTRAHDVDNASPPSHDIYDNVGGVGPRTSAVVLWDNIPAWTQDVEYISPEIRTVIQEVIDRPGWASGNAISIFWEDDDQRSTQAIFTFRAAYSYDNDPTKTPKLHIEYTTP